MTAAGEEKTAAAMAATGEPLFTRRIEFHQARRPYTGVPISSGDFRLEILNPSNLDERRAASGCGVGPSASETGEHVKRSAGGEAYDHGLDPELSFRISFQRIGAGLENLGNTCYLNSVLQCLTYTEPFAAYLHSGKHKSTCRAAGFCALCALQNHVMDALQSTGKILRPFHLVRNLRCISRSFRNSRQEDAHEYMVNLLESMHKCCLPSGVPTESPSAYEKSLVHKIFGGQLRSQVKCMQCSYCSNKFDPFLDLSLEIVRADSLRKAFAHFTATEELDGGEKQYQCQRCKEKVQAFKQLTIHKAPYVLTIHLKRFGSSIRGEKISKKVEFETTLDLKPFVSGSQEGELKYTLYGVLVHAGWSTHSGHYFCYVRTSSGLWYSLDDNHVSQVSEKTVLSREAYMLFYVKDRVTNIKRSVEAKLNTGISANSNGNKGTQLAEGKLNAAVCSSSSAKTRHDVIFQSLSMMGSSMQNQLKNQQRAAVQFKEISFDVKEGNAIKSAQETAPLQKMETICTTNGKDDKRPLISSNAMNGPIKEAADTKIKEHKAHFSDMKGQKDGVTLTKNVEVPLKAAKGQYLGRRQLFFVSLRLHKKKKRRTKTHHRNSTTNNEMNGWMADPCTDPQGTASTSETIEIKRERNIRQGKEIHAHRKGGERNGEILESFPASLRETTVARWDAKGVLAAQAHESDDPPKRSIGYLLDEWDEEYDRGKRKKLKSRQWFAGPNPFQKTADLLRTHRSSFGNESH